jgi:predicted nuclease of predicted toxin-antitoxin system
MPKYIADVHISPLTVSELQQAGYDIDRVTDFLPATASDEEIITFAITVGAVIVTQDLDFSALIVQSGLAKPSVVSLRLGNARPHIVTQILKQVLPQIQAELEAGVIVSVEESHFRIRELPVAS